jgi:hypothetical protein
MGRRGVGYGDLSAADEVCEWRRGAPASRWTMKRLLAERGVLKQALRLDTHNLVDDNGTLRLRAGDILLHLL